MYMQGDDQQKLQLLLERIFPVYKEVPVNSIAASVFGEGEEKSIYFLVVGDDKMVTSFLADDNDETKIKAVTKATKKHSALYYDLMLNLEFYFRNRRGKALFNMVFPAGNPELQDVYVKAMKEVTTMRFLIADKDRHVCKMMEINWYYYKVKRIIEKIEKARKFKNESN